MDFKPLDRICEKIKDAFGIPSISAAFFADGEVHTCSLGCDEDTLFAIGSCTKSFTAGTILSLQDRGSLSLDDKVKDRIPGFRLSDAEIEEKLSIRDVLCHRSGLPGCDLSWYSRHDMFTDEDLLKAVSLLPKSCELGEKHQYNNMVYALSGKIIENCTGADWKEAVREYILEPLGIRNYAFSAAEAAAVGSVAVPYINIGNGIREVPHADTGAIAPAGSLYMTASELLKWDMTLLHGGEYLGKRVLSRDAVREMEEGLIPDEPGLPVPELTDAAKDRMYGLGLQMETFRGEKLIYHGGAIDGFLANQSILPSKDCASVLLTDLGGTLVREAFMHAVNGFYLGDETDWIMLFSALQKELEEAVMAEASEGVFEDANLPGVYQNPLFGMLEISAERSGLQARIGNLTMPAKVTPEGVSFWHMEFGLLVSEIVRDAFGAVTALRVPADPTIPEKFEFTRI